MTTFLKNGGWQNGEFLHIESDETVNGRRVQIVSRRSMNHTTNRFGRAYYQVRDGQSTTELGAAVKSVKSAKAAI